MTIRLPAVLTGETTGTPCTGCVGRGTGACCCMCGGPIPQALRITPDSAPEWSASCVDCVNGRTHAHR